MQRSILFFFLLLPLLASARYGVYGYVDTPEHLPAGESTLTLYQMQLSPSGDAFEKVPLARTTVESDGYFYFSDNLFDEQDAFYQIRMVLNGEEIEREAVHLFIHSRTDSLFFNRSNRAFGAFLSSNMADWEWQKLRAKQTGEDLRLPTNNRTADYVRDSLQILLVKLIGLKQLEEKQLLASDISEHPDYYNTLLEELYTSELDPAQYGFLLAAYHTYADAHHRRQLGWSWALSGLLGLLLIGLVYRWRTRSWVVASPPPPQLSAREATIRALILAGKSNKEIAAELFVSVHTVKSHITTLYQKLGVRSRREVY